MLIVLFYNIVLQICPPKFCLTCINGNMRAQDNVKLGRVFKHANKVIGIQQALPGDLYKSPLLNKITFISYDSSHPLHLKFQKKP